MAIPRRVSGSISPIGSQNQARLVAYALNRSRKQRNQLAITNLPLVKQLARRESQRTAVPMEDLEQSGYLGLIKALEAFDPARSTALSSFAVPYIRGAIRQYLRDRCQPLRTSRGLRELHGRGQRLQLEWQQRGQGALAEAPLARMLGVSIGRWREACAAERALRVTSLDQARPGFEGDGDGPGPRRSQGWADVLADPGGLDPLEWACGLERRQRLQQLLGLLEPQERTLLLGRVLGNQSFKDLGLAIGVSAKVARRRHQALLTWLRPQLDPGLLP
jgi:RNA polymerase sigma factor (sigma-70 family)